MANEQRLQITVVFSPVAGQVLEKKLELPQGSTLDDALQASGFLSDWPELAVAGTLTGVWGRKVCRQHCLQAGDRVEIYRPLKADPKVSRRERFSRQGVRTAGLFARQDTPVKRVK